MRINFLTKQNCGKTGFTLLQLLVVVGLLFLLSAAMFPMISSALFNAKFAVIAHRGRDIYQAITTANVEREAVGLPALWPSDEIYTNSVSGQIESFNFTNSTDYFMCIYDYKNAGTPQHSPLVKGFNYYQLAGAEVSVCSSNVLQPENNMWTIAKNVSKETPGIMPVLVSRNVDASSLTLSYKKNDNTNKVSLAGEFDMPFSTKAAVVIYKDGRFHVVHYDITAYRYVYKRKSCESNLENPEGVYSP
ncbi:MAG: hypothetical protein PHO37_13570 [Kiritimatiellae bacterium]|nr:hypothetical protein [Kiritimatiellia bacterium]